MTSLRRTSAAVVLIAFCGFVAQSIDLHVHAGGEHDDHHRAPAFHHHASHLRIPVDELRITEVDADDTAIAVSLYAGSVSDPHSHLARPFETVRLPEPSPIVIAAMRVTPRAHGPPSTRPCSLRAPPFSTLL